MDLTITQELKGSDYKLIFESVLGCYLILSPELVIVAVSDAYNNVTMTKRKEIIGRALFEVFPDNPDDEEADGVTNLRASLTFVLANKAQHTMAIQKYDIRRPDGTFEERYWSPVNKPVLNEQNEVVYIIHRVEDVTDFVDLQKEQAKKDKLANELQSRAVELETELIRRSQEIQKLNHGLEQKVKDRTEQLEEVSKAISDYKFALDESSIVAVTDHHGIIKSANDNFCRISKFSKEELIGQDHRIVNSGYHSKEFIRQLWRTISSGRIWRGELRNRAKDGTIYWVATTIVPFLDAFGKPYQYVAIRSDITQRKKVEEDILRLNDELENKVVERTLELTQALEREKEMNEMKSRFVSMASHEFRTPLSAILSSAALIRQYQLTEQQDKRNKHTERITSSVRNLITILDDFLSLDKLEQGKTAIVTSTFVLEDFIHSVVEEVDSILREGQHILYSPGGMHEVVLDKQILHNIILNLLSNAIKYSEQDIDLHTSVSTEGIFISVADKGIGIPQEEQKLLFEKFYRARNATNIQGTGLGLNIVKRYLELMGGSISFSSKVYEGTTFTVHLPNTY